MSTINVPNSESVQPAISKGNYQLVNHLQNKWLIIIGAVVILFLSVFHLTSYPLTWFDEGSHLHVPKTLVQYGIYADKSSEGFRYYGPTVGVGPTVFLPIAMVFKLVGVGLLQARSVMVLYLLSTIVALYFFALRYGGKGYAVLVIALVVTSRGVGLLEYGREVLGEVPGLFFMITGLLLWLSTWGKPKFWPLVAAGLLLGLSLVTKNQYLIVLGPGLGLVFFANLIYYKTVPHKVFIITGIVTILVYAIWQGVLVFSLGPATASQNWTLFRQATTESALIFSPTLMKRAVTELLSLKVYFGVFLPALVYGFTLILPRNRDGLRWAVVFYLIVANVAWYVLASISWIRYAFPALVFTSLFVAKLFIDLTNGLTIDFRGAWNDLRTGKGLLKNSAISLTLLFWLGLMIIIPFAQSTKDIVKPAFNAPIAMAAYMNAHVDKNVVVETWEPEMGFLTDHNYHFPPPELLYAANGFIWLGKAPPADKYNFVQVDNPEYVLVGPFSDWVQLYPVDFLRSHYKLMTTISGYKLYNKN